MRLADGQDAADRAFHADRRLRHARRLDLDAGSGGQPRQHELVHVRRIVTGAEVHLLGALVVHDVDDELARCLDVA